MRKFGSLLIAISLALFILGYFALRYFEGSYFKNHLLPQLVSTFESKTPFKLKLGDTELSLFRGLLIKDSFIKMKSGSEEIQASLPELRIRYSLWSLISKKFKVSKMSIIDPSIEASLRIEISKDTKKSEPLWPLIEDGLKALETLPIEINLQNFELSNLKAKIQVSEGGKLFDLLIVGLNLGGSLRANPSSLEWQSRVDIPEDGLSLSTLKVFPMALELKLRGQSSINFEAKKSEAWSISIPKIESRFHLFAKSGELTLVEEKIEILDKDKLFLGSEGLIRISEFKGIPKDWLVSIKKFAPLDVRHQLKIQMPKLNEFLLDYLKFQKIPSITYESTVETPEFLFDKHRVGAGSLRKTGVLKFEGAEASLSQEASLNLTSVRTLSENSIIDTLFGQGIKMGWSFQASPSSFQLRTLTFENNDQSLSIESSAQVRKPLKDLFLKGRFRWKSGEGRLEFPFNLKQSRASRYRFESRLQCDKFFLQSSQVEVEDLFCDVPIRVDFNWAPGKSFQFTNPQIRNPFERVDYLSIRPFTENQTSNLRFKKLQYKGLKLGPLFADLSVRQNLILAEQYQLDLLDGRISGLVFADLLPDRPRFGYLGRVTALKPALLNSNLKVKSDARLSSRAAVIYDFKKVLVEGRLDITEIGSGQMIEVIRFIDPKRKNEKLNLARSLLKIGYPTYVGLEMAQGFLNLSLDLGGLVAVRNLRLEGIPLNPVLRMAEESFFQSISKGTK